MRDCHALPKRLLFWTQHLQRCSLHDVTPARAVALATDALSTRHDRRTRITVDHREGYRVVEAVDAVDRASAVGANSSGRTTALCGCSAGSGSLGRHYQSRFEDREAGVEPRSPGVDGRVRFDLAGIGTEGEAAAGHQQASDSGKSRTSSSSACLITWRRWRSSPSTPGVAMVRSASCAGSGSSSCNR